MPRSTMAWAPCRRWSSAPASLGQLVDLQYDQPVPCDGRHLAALLDLFVRVKALLAVYRQSKDAGVQDDPTLQEAYKKLHVEFTNLKPAMFECPECSAMWAELGPQMVPELEGIPAVIEAARRKRGHP